jgi:hypothetical protein
MRKLSARFWTHDVFILLEASLLLCFAQLLAMTMKFNRFSRVLGKQVSREPGAPDEAQLARAQEVASAIALVRRLAPWKSRCLAQAIAAQIMLKRRRINSTLYLGVAQHAVKGLRAHAWVKCGGAFLTGERLSKNYTVVAMFSSEFSAPKRPGGEGVG